MFIVLPFGMAEACFGYTTVIGEVYRPLRQMHQSLSFLIDDGLFATQSKLHTYFLAKTLAMLLTAGVSSYLVKSASWFPLNVESFLGCWWIASFVNW